MNLNSLIQQVKLNCNISDAKYWGYYSICGMLLRLRHLYRVEHSLKPWESIPTEDITKWISEREALWETLQDKPLQPIRIEDNIFDPFSFEEINNIIEKEGLVYGGGFGMFNKPTFFLAKIEELKEVYDYKVYYAERELCRDMSYSAAMVQGRCIYIRFDPLLIMLWEKLLEMRAGRSSTHLKEAFEAFGVYLNAGQEQELYKKLEKLCRELSPLLLFHEIGEVYEDESIEQWLSILQKAKNREQELYLRAIKDIMADTSELGPLKFIVEERDIRLLHFYIALLDRERRELFPEILTSYTLFRENRNWQLIEDARKKGYERAKELYRKIISVAPEGIEKIITKELSSKQY
jgi:hypothetical protein